MPVPKNDAAANGPRTLLRDVVYEKMVTAIQDGTLVPGERINDDELTTWLGVSRTPVREAVSRLVAEGFIEMAANRYTRVSSLSATEYGHAWELLAGLHAITRQHPKFDEALTADVRKRAAKLTKHDLDTYRDALDLLGEVTAALGNPLLTDAERTARGRAKFHATADRVEIDWADVDGAVQALASS